MTPRIEFAFEAHGEAGAPALVFLHGFLGRGSDWRGIAAAFAGARRVLCPDLPYHGATRVAPGPPVTMAQCADALEAWLASQDARPAALAGYSMGGRLAIEIAVRHPARVACLVLESAAPGIEDDAARAARRDSDERLAGRLDAIGDAAALRAFLDAWYAQPLFAGIARRGALVDARMHNDPRALAASLRGMGAGSQDSHWPAVAALPMPVLCIAGGSDAKYAGIAARIAAPNPRAALEVLPGCGHNVHWDAPDRYTRCLRRFLAARV